MQAEKSLLIWTVSLLLCASGCRHNTDIFNSPDQVLNTLKSGGPDEKTRMERDLHMPSVFIKDCENGDAILRELELLPAILEDGKRNAIITGKCGWNFLLVAFVQEKNGKWRYEDSIPLSAVYDVLSVTLQPIVNPPVQEILVSEHVPAWGTGIYQGDFLILKVIDGRIRVVLDEIEQMHSDPLYVKVQVPSILQQSTFKVIPKTGKDSASIEETQTFTVGSKGTVSERLFEWNENLHIFEVGFWETSKPILARQK